MVAAVCIVVVVVTGGGGSLENEIVKEECVERVITHARWHLSASECFH